jgi:hypothetical protein
MCREQRPARIDHIDGLELLVSDLGLGAPGARLRERDLFRMALMNGHIDVIEFHSSDLDAAVEEVVPEFGVTGRLGSVSTLKYLFSRMGLTKDVLSQIEQRD